MSEDTDPNYTIRMYTNPKYGKFKGPGLPNKILFNGTIQFSGKKYVFDLAPLEDAKYTVQGFHPADLKRLKEIASDWTKEELFQKSKISNLYVAQLFFYSRETGKEPVDGCILCDVERQFIVFDMTDIDRAIEFNDATNYYGCPVEKQGKNSPDFFASNYDHSQAA